MEGGKYVERICLNCKGHYIAIRCTSKFCSPRCRASNQSAIRKQIRQAKIIARLKSKAELFDKTSFARYLVSEVRRAKTIQILEGMTGEELVQLLQLTRNRTTFNGTSDGQVNEVYELSHIVAVHDATRLGLLHPRNIVIAPRSFNRARATKPALEDQGLSIPREKLDPLLKVTSLHSFKALLKKIKRYLGSEVLDYYLSNAKQTLTQKNTLIRKLAKFTSIEPKHYRCSLEELALELREYGVEVSLVFSRPGRSEINVALSELERLGYSGSILHMILEWIAADEGFGRTLATSLIFDGTEERRRFRAFVIEQVWRKLHGEKYSLLWEQEGIVKHLLQCFALGSDLGAERLALDNVLRSSSTFMSAIKEASGRHLENCV